MTAIRKAVAVLNPHLPTIGYDEMNESTLEVIPRPEGSSDVAPERAQVLSDMELYTSGFPCPTCMTAICWFRISVVYYACSAADTLESGIQGMVVESE